MEENGTLKLTFRGGHLLRAEARGNIVEREYEIDRGGDKVAQVSKHWFRMRDTYGIAIVEGQDDALIIAVAVCIDQMAHNME